MLVLPMLHERKEIVWVDDRGKPTDTVRIRYWANNMPKASKGHVVGFDDCAVCRAEDDDRFAHVQCFFENSHTRTLDVSRKKLFDSNFAGEANGFSM